MVPKTIRIGCYDYKVVETDDIIVVDNVACKGAIEYDNKVIKIKAGMEEQTKEQTFWHEVVHGIIQYRQVNPQRADEETLVDELATGIYGIMKASTGPLPGQIWEDRL